MRPICYAILATAALLAGCFGPAIRPNDTHWRPGLARNAYKNVIVHPPRYDPDGVASAVENAFARTAQRSSGVRDTRPCVADREFILA